jgi:hypothetical protein
MTKEQNIIRAKVGPPCWNCQAARQCQPGLQNDDRQIKCQLLQFRSRGRLEGVLIQASGRMLWSDNPWTSRTSGSICARTGSQTTVFENYDAIVDAACAAWRKLIAQRPNDHLHRNAPLGSRRSAATTGFSSGARD